MWTFPTETPPQKVNGRLGSKKTKTGCLTCRKHRVKCDEQRPLCKRCRRLKLHCAGYQDLFRIFGISRQGSAYPASKPNRPAANPDRQLSIFPGSDEERRLFELFRTSVVFQLSGFLDEDFWITTLLQVSHLVSLVRDSAIAIAAHIAEHHRHFRTTTPQQSRNISLKYYQKALHRANWHTESADKELVAVICCPLFLCLEFLQGKKLQAMSLFARGHCLMKTFQERHARNFAVSGCAAIYDSLRPMYNRLTMMAKLFGHSLPVDYSDLAFLLGSNPTIYTVNTLKDARDCLFQHLVIAHEFVKRLNSTTCAPLAMHKHHLHRQEELLSQLDVWNSNFNHICGSLAVSVRAAVATLSMWHTAAVIWLRHPFEGFEMTFDESLDCFQIIVEKAKEALTTKQNVQDTFAFGMGVLPPLYFTSLKCRHFFLRKEALRLMRQCPKMEGLWDRDELITVASHAFALETSAQSEITSLPAEHQRLIKVKILQGDAARRLQSAFIFREHKVEQAWNKIIQ
ncbi:uncharacterized protein PV06_10546 [Exophiala oligosperma]|uniref:Zn(2)-C6 fungal-type domain-containing protein n=1 Tax=Exophiala oligosperma TaxID=215243 RepID=A0A0D2A9Z9_9EURO|nr:uncharacterized protein PV06_10546 [Exophiala oligosperma]KIW37196.1 hypothetical protein PV06_10546 [Exophiala oligosperma]